MMAEANPIQMQKYLKGMKYPADKQALVDHAKEQGADENVLNVLQQLKEDRFETPADVSKAAGEAE